MRKHTRLVIACVTFAALALAGCGGKEQPQEEAFQFVVFPGAHYLTQLTDVTKNAHKLLAPGEEIPPTAIYDTDAPLDDVVNYYVKEYGYGSVAADATNSMQATKPNAYWRSGDLAADAKAVEPLAAKMNIKMDPSKAVGTYKAAELAPKANRPRVTIQRPYFDVTTSQTVNKTLILMSR